MADPAHQTPEEIRPDITPDIPGLRALEGGSESITPKSGHLRDVSSDASASEGGDTSSGSLNKQESGRGSGFFNPGGDKKGGLLQTLKRRKKLAAAGVFGVSAIVSMIVGVFMSIGSLNLTNFMANVEEKGFLRYQVDMHGRSSKWVSAYLQVRMGEAQGRDPMKENLYFKSDRVDNNRPFTDWYKTLRSTSFEDDIFKKYGITFQSVAVNEKGSTHLRTAWIRVKGKEVAKYNTPEGKVWSALGTGDINKTLDVFSEKFDIEHMKDKDARAALNEILKTENPHWWQSYKRRYLRLAMMNRLGIRKWSFFETTRGNMRESYIDGRNKIVSKVIKSSLPDGVSQTFLNCLFGLAECRASTDPINPDLSRLGDKFITQAAVSGATHGVEHLVVAGGGPEHGGTSTKNSADVGVGVMKEAMAASADAGGAASGLAVRKMVIQTIQRANTATFALSMMDGFAKFHDALKASKLSSIITLARSSYAMGLYSTFKIADDQMKTGDMNTGEFGHFMDQYGNLNNGEGWTAITGSENNSSVSAASTEYAAAANKQEFCSDKHQAEMDKPENNIPAEKEYQYLCENDVIGGASNAKRLEESYNQSFGKILDPLVWAYDLTPLHVVNEWIGKVGDKVFGRFIKGTLSVLGIRDDIGEVFGYIAQEALQFGGADMNISTLTPSGRVGNLVVEGGSALSESASRMTGAALTTALTSQQTNARVLAYEQQQMSDVSFYDRYLSLDSPRSLASMQVPFIANLRYGNIVSTLRVFFASVLSSPLKIFSMPTHAAVPDGYTAAHLSSIETYDYPAECMNSDPTKVTPADSTNADELGYIPANELTWDLMRNQKDWSEKLFQSIGAGDDQESKAKQVWNCALLDNAVSGGIGDAYGYKGDDYLEDMGGSGSAGTLSSVSGDAKTLASEIIASNKLGGSSTYINQIRSVATGDNSCPVDPVILTMLAGVIKEGHLVDISSLNRKCTGVITDSGTKSDHYRDGGGHAVDVTGFDNKPVTGGNTATKEFLDVAIKYLPQKGIQYGQLGYCGLSYPIPTGSVNVDDTCNHQHIGAHNVE